MADTAKRLDHRSPTAATNTTAYTVPASTTAIVRNIHINNSNASTNTIYVAINGTTETATNRILDFTLPTQSSYDWNGFLVLNATDTIQIQASLATAVFTISGVEVT